MNKQKQERIDPEKWYMLVDIVNQGLFPWCKSIATIRKWVNADRKSGNYLNAVVVGKGTNTRYRIKGESIISFLIKIEDGKYSVFNKNGKYIK